MLLEKELRSEIANSFLTTFNEQISLDEVKLQPTNKEFEGDFTFVTFPFLRISKKSPEETGKLIGNFLLEKTTLISAFNVVKGFLNIVVSDGAWISLMNEIASKDNFGSKEPTGKQVMVEYSSPNTNKPLHLGHLRNNFLGYSVAKILEANGWTVHKVQIVNDRGIHICKSMLAWQKYGNGETPESSGLKGDKLVGKYYVIFEQRYREEVRELIKEGKSKEEAEKEAPMMQKAQALLKKWEEKDQETYSLWETMNNWVYAGFDETYRKMGVDFDRLY